MNIHITTVLAIACTDTGVRRLRAAAAIVVLGTWAGGQAFAAAPAPTAGVEAGLSPQFADLGKGQRQHGVGPASFEPDGRPRPVSERLGHVRPPASRYLTTPAEIAQALDQAQPGDVLEIAPGSYTIGRALQTGQAGTALQPITLRARHPGDVTLQLNGTQAVVVSQPYWVFENLDWRGVCARDEDCEHALHVVGRARSTVILNNRMTDFNAQVKINGHHGHFPDDGLLQFSTLVNTRPRQTRKPVTPFDLVAASGWQVLDNHVENFAKAASESPSYGMFMKGAGHGGRIERNVVVCAPPAGPRPGLRIGISLGNGGTGQRWCRDQRCAAEHADGLIANNVVAHCNRAGVDVAGAVRTTVVHNTLIETQGIQLRRPPATAIVDRNLLDDRVRAQGGTRLEAGANLSAWSLKRWLRNPDTLDLRWLQAPPDGPSHRAAPQDFCGRSRAAQSPPGALLAAPC